MELPLVQCKKCKHLTTITNEYLCPFDWCENVLDSPDRDLQRRCERYQAATNADRVRNMDDYDLAIFLENVSCKHADTGSWLDWLKQEAK